MTSLSHTVYRRYTVPHEGTLGGFNETALLISDNGVTFYPANLSVGPTELAE
jgi:hypothetical protein